jgi:hypothetical protein
MPALRLVTAATTALLIFCGAIPRSRAEEQVVPLWSIPIAQLGATADRPLFSPNRRPAVNAITTDPTPTPTPSPPAVEIEEPPPHGSLVGVIKGEEGFAVALVVEDSSTPPKRLRLGDLYENWKLVAITRASATLRKESRTFELKIKTPSSADAAGRSDPTSSAPASSSEPPRSRRGE